MISWFTELDNSEQYITTDSLNNKEAVATYQDTSIAFSICPKNEILGQNKGTRFKLNRR